MLVADAQREVRFTYIGGFVGQLVSAALWLASAVCTTSISPHAGIVTLVLRGILIFPTTQLVLLWQGRSASLSPNNPLRELAIEVAFLIALLLPMVGAASLHREVWFYPAMMIVVGAHYVFFSFLYGMRQFIALAGVLLVGGCSSGSKPLSWPLSAERLPEKRRKAPGFSRGDIRRAQRNDSVLASEALSIYTHR